LNKGCIILKGCRNGILFLLQTRMYKNYLTTNCIMHIIQLKELYYSTNTVKEGEKTNDFL